MRSAPQRFWAKVEKTADCWLWRGGLNENGYGVFRLNNRTVLSHRVAYELSNGTIPDGLLVCHHCDNPPCMRPDHLFIGTNADNVRDRVEKGRSAKGGAAKGEKHWSKTHPERIARGEKHGRAVLAEEEVRAIRSRYQTGVITQYRLAEEFGVRKGTISRVLRRESWAHVQ